MKKPSLPRGHISKHGGDLRIDEASGVIETCCLICNHEWVDHRDDDGGHMINSKTTFIYCKHCFCTGGFGR